MISVRGGWTRIFFVSSTVLGLSVAVACSSDDEGTRLNVTPTTSDTDAATNTTDPSKPEKDATPGEDAADASDATVALQGCAAHPGAAFCDDFDSPDALKPGNVKWDFIEPTDQPVATISSDKAVSKPSSLLSRVIDKTTPGAKFAKTITKADFKEVTWEYDVFLDNIGTTDGFFLDDFQFSDSAGTDSFGFRLVMFSNAGAIGDFRVEHNAGANGGPYVMEPNLPTGTATMGAWHHFKQDVTFTFAATDAGADGGDGGDAGTGNFVTYTLTVDDAATPTFTKKYAGITRAQTSFARFAGMSLIFNKENSAGLKIYWDNHVTELK